MQDAFTVHGVTPVTFYLITPDIMVDVLKGVTRGDMTNQLAPTASALDAFGRDTYEVGDWVEILLDQEAPGPDALGDDDAEDRPGAESLEFEPLVPLAKGVIVDATPITDGVTKAFKVSTCCT